MRCRRGYVQTSSGKIDLLAQRLLLARARSTRTWRCRRSAPRRWRPRSSPTTRSTPRGCVRAASRTFRRSRATARKPGVPRTGGWSWWSSSRAGIPVARLCGLRMKSEFEFEFAPATEADFPALLALRIVVKRDSLERIGRFDLERAAQRFRSTFRPDDTRLIRVGDATAGCVAWCRPIDTDSRWRHSSLLPSGLVRIGSGIRRSTHATRPTLPRPPGRSTRAAPASGRAACGLRLAACGLRVRVAASICIGPDC